MSATLAKIAMISNILAATAVPAVAATESRGNSSESIIWGFLGLCALIVIAQIAPMIRNLRKQSKTAADQTKAAKLQQLQ
jgi:galactitol-specific phosphotransferase system IIC component